MEVTVKLICTKLPGRAFSGVSLGVPFSYENVHLGIQRGEEIVDAVPADTKTVTFTPVFRVEPLDGGRTNFLGPYAKGPRDERFFYLSWFDLGRSGAKTMFRRAKIHLSQLPWGTVEAAVAANAPVEMRVELTDPKGGPRCASIRPA